MEAFFALDDDALALVEFIKTLFGRLPNRFQFGFAFFFLRFQKTQRLADDLACILVASGGNLPFDEIVEMICEINVACWHGIHDSGVGNFCQWVGGGKTPENSMP
jgi:hypothetical protein